jgi:elongation factor P--beta-lysine ligase
MKKNLFQFSSFFPNCSKVAVGNDRLVMTPLSEGVSGGVGIRKKMYLKFTHV